jgi:hypothetical protein
MCDAGGYPADVRLHRDSKRHRQTPKPICVQSNRDHIIDANAAAERRDDLLTSGDSRGASIVPVRRPLWTGAVRSIGALLHWVQHQPIGR